MGIICIVLLSQACVSGQDAPEFKSIHEAAAAGNARGLLSFIQKGVSVNSRDGQGRTPIMSAAEAGMHRIFPLLAAQGAEINAVDNQGNTALHIGAAKGNAKVIGDLIAGGADQSIKNREGLLAKAIAEKAGNTRAVAAFPAEVTESQNPYGDRYGDPYGREYQQPEQAKNSLKDILNDPNEIKARLKSDPNLLKEMSVLFKALEAEETKWTSRKRLIKNTFLTSLRKEIDSEIVFVQKVAKAEDANDLVKELDVIQSTWKSIFSQSSRKMRDAARGMTGMGMQMQSGYSRGRSRRGQMGASTRGSRRSPRAGGETGYQPEINPHQQYIDSWGMANDNSLDSIYQATQDKFMLDMDRIRVLADKGGKKRTVNAIDGVMLERKLRGERSLAVYGLTKAEMSSMMNPGMGEDGTMNSRTRRGSSQRRTTGRRRR